MLCVPCPYFHPARRAEWLGSYPRLPLGAAWEGACHATAEMFEPSGVLLFEVCNTGFGRARCPRFPAHAPHDAVRFHVLGQGAGASLRIGYVFERGCWPASHAAAEVDPARGIVDPAPESPALAAQLLAFASTVRSLG